MSPPPPVPPGWYPDPAGQRQWRVWTGERWSEVTRTYGEPTPAPSATEVVAAAGALRRVMRQGALGLLGGIGLVVSAWAHWPGSASPLSSGMAAILLDAGIALILIGSIAYGGAAYEMAGGLTLWAVIPVVNAVVVTAAVNRAVRGPGRAYVVAVEVLAVALFISGARRDPWLGVLPALVAEDLLLSAQRLLHQVLRAGETAR